MKRVCIFCASNKNVSDFFYNEMENLVQEISKADYQIVYGGSNCGLMGALADHALKKGVKVIGIMPTVFDESVTHNGLTELKKVTDMGERKKLMLEMSDAFIVFPGGIGTLDEAIEMMCYKQIKIHNKPIVFLNYLNFWQPFLDALELIKEQGMISGPLSDYYDVVDSASEAVGYLKKALKA